LRSGFALVHPKGSRYFYAAWTLKQRVTSAVRKACQGLSHLATALAHSGAVASPAIHKYADMCEARTSPVSVDHDFATDDPTPEPVRAVLPIVLFSLSFLYQQLIKHKLWTASFERGGAAGAHGPAVRSLVTRHLSSPAVDGWNVVAGAVELASVWALRSNDLPNVLVTAFDLSYETRLRLAVCLSVAWKFERQLCTHFPRRFHDAKPNLVSPHTCELAYIGLSFMTEAERAAFGTWEEANACRVRVLYREMLSLEVRLLKDVPVFCILTNSAPVQAEERIQALFESDLVSAEEAMIARSIVPFFNVVWQNGYSPQPTAGALVCAAMQCVCATVAEGRRRSRDAATTFRSTFAAGERARARELLRSGLHLKEMPTAIVRLGCYSDPSWVNHQYISVTTLEHALELATDR
jgi:hypothetical protein